MKKGFAAERKSESGPRTALGTLLIEEGLIDSGQLEEALRIGADSGERLGEVLVRMGWATEEDLARILAHQWNLRCLERSAISFDPNALARLSREDATTLEALPMRIADDGSLVVAVAEPTEARLLALRSRFGDRIECVVIPKTALDVGLRGELLARTSPSRKEEPIDFGEFVAVDEPEVEAGSMPELELLPGLEIADEAKIEPANVATIEPDEPYEPDEQDELPAAVQEVVEDFDQAAGAMISLVEEQLSTLRTVVVEAEASRSRAEQARNRAEEAQAEAEAEIARLKRALAERETSERELQQNLREIADRLLPPPGLS